MHEDTIHRRRWATLGVLCLSLMIIGLDNTILNVALPTLASDLSASDKGLQWIVDGYTLVFAGLLLTAGSLADRFGRKRALASGLAIFGLASLAAAFSATAGQLIAARCAMGVGAAFIMPATLSVLTHSFRDPAERAKAIGIWAGVAGLGIVVGPTVGGWLLGHFWWGSVFLINVPVVILALIFGHTLVPESKDATGPGLDWPGAVLSTAGLVTLVWAIIEAPSAGWSSPTVLTALAAATVLLLSFGVWQTRAPAPMLDLAFFRDARFSSAALSITLVFFALFGTMFFLTQHLQMVMGYDALEAGKRILPIATMVVFAPLSMKLAQKLGTKIVVTTGLTTVSGALLLLSTTSITDGYGHVATALALLGAGMGLTMAPATHAVMDSLPEAKAGVGSAVNDAVRQVGGALGVAVLGSVLSSAYGARLSDTAGEGVPEEAREGLGVALTVAGRLDPESAQALADAARESFVHAMDVTVLVAAAVAFVGALTALFWMPGKPAVTDQELAELTMTEPALAPSAR